MLSSGLRVSFSPREHPGYFVSVSRRWIWPNAQMRWQQVDLMCEAEAT